MSGHVTTLLNLCASVLYALRTLRAHGMRQDCLHEVFRSTVLAKLLYASPALSGFCSAGDINKLDRFLNRCKSLNYCSQTTSHVAELFDVADESLFKTVLHRLLSNNKISVYYLRSRTHNLTLTSKSCFMIIVILLPGCYFPSYWTVFKILSRGRYDWCPNDQWSIFNFQWSIFIHCLTCCDNAVCHCF